MKTDIYSQSLFKFLHERFELLNKVASYDWKLLRNSVDFFILPTFNLITPAKSPKTALHPHPLSSTNSASNTVDSVVRTWINYGYSSDKLVITIPTRGQRWILTSTVTRPPAPAKEASRDIIDYRDICQLEKNKGWTKFQDPKNQTGPYIFLSKNSKSRYWIGYDDPPMASFKAEYIKAQNLLGAHVIIATSVFSESSDDYDNSCRGGVYPIIRAVAKTLL